MTTILQYRPSSFQFDEGIELWSFLLRGEGGGGSVVAWRGRAGIANSCKQMYIRYTQISANVITEQQICLGRTERVADCFNMPQRLRDTLTIKQGEEATVHNVLFVQSYTPVVKNAL